MDDLAKLIEVEKIFKLKGRLQRALDAGRWDEFADCLAEDFTVWETGMIAELTGRDTVLAQTRHSFENFGRWKVSGKWKVRRTRVTLSAAYAAQDVRERRLKH